MNIQSLVGEGHYFGEGMTVSTAVAWRSFISADQSLGSQPEKIKDLLNRSSTDSKAGLIEKTEGMKYLLAVSLSLRLRPSRRALHFFARLQQMSKGSDVSEFFADVVRNVIVGASLPAAHYRASWFATTGEGS